MSQWNNSYAYNNQYQGANVWTGDANGQQFTNQGYYPNPSDQYVSFNEFLSQMQVNNAAAPAAGNYDNTHFQNYPVSQQYTYQNVPAASQNAQPNSYDYSPNASNNSGAPDEFYQEQSQYNAVLPEPSSYTNEMVFQSNLTPTAIEFVPKSTVSTTSSVQNVQPEASATYNGANEASSSQGSSSNRNWRERPQSSQQNSSRHNDTYRQNEANRYESRNHSHKNYEGKELNTNSRNREYTNRKNESSSNNYENGSHSNESGSRNHESKNRNYESSRRHYESSNRNDESSSRNYESNGRNPDFNGRNHESNNRNYESSDRYDESSDRNYESSSRYNDNKGQPKSKSKSKDAERTYYNSSINKSSQDVRSGKGESSGRKNWAGSQRVRPVDQNIAEVEQFANSYMHYRDEKERNAKTDHVSSPRRNNNKNAAEGGTKEMTQRERLSDQLDKGTLECLVCCERVKQTDTVWSCSNCYHVLHLRCIRKWALSSIVDCKWRCPACQNTSEDVPVDYRCLCGAVRAPEYLRGAAGAHTCGRACKRARGCPHPCPLHCHPGPCPPCIVLVNRECGCGAEKHRVACGNKSALVCERPCNRTLACGAHHCAKPCHEGPCEPCAETVTQVCYCTEAIPRTVACTGESAASASWACGGACSRVLACGVHVCLLACHAPPCGPCALRPETVNTCPCGRTELKPNSRNNCTDPIPVCGNICAKPLPCGPPGDKHFCKLNCHEGDCPVCPEKTLLQCRCGHSSREVPCEELPEMVNNVLCQKKCNKKLSCGRHRCRTVCCAAQSHRCAVVCGRTLSCQLHRCEEFCHTGHCAPCPRVSFDELSCECGAEVLLPPVRCGAKPPACGALCRRARPCGHAPHHACHSGDCPPCVVLTTKMCHGNHEERKTIPCSQDEFSCGLPCGKPLPCGKHSCIKTCHKGPCDTGKCTQPCNEKRPSCGHPCSAACHAGGGGGACPSATPCRRLVRATCPCARRHADRACCDNARDLARIMSALAATKMQEGGSVDLSDVQRPGAMLKTLECDDECRVEARTRQMALALQIRNPDVSAKLAPRYSDHLRNTAGKEPAFAQQIHDKLTELVQLAKKSKQKTRAHSFPSMNWQKRQFIHELCEHFGCESVAYDAEPNRNVVATADKEKSWLPAMSVLEVLAREAGKRRVPGPILRAPAAQHAANAMGGNGAKSGGWATLTSTNAWAARSQAKQASQSVAVALPPVGKIDYFDNPPEN